MYNRKSILVYVGANRGYGLLDLLHKRKFDTIFAFEPDPDMHSSLQHNILHSIPYPAEVHLVNAACSSSEGVQDLYIFSNRVSTSLGDANYDIDKPCVTQIIQSKTINLFDFLQSNGVDHIDYLLTDCQGSDLVILKSIIPFIEEKKIDVIFHETHRDDFSPYTGLVNHFSEFKKILNDNYKIEYFSYDGLVLQGLETPEYHEWDTCWIKK